MTIKMDAPVTNVSRAVDVKSTASVSRAGADRSDAVCAAAAVDSMRLTGEANDLKAMEEGMDKTNTPFDLGRVERLRAAIADGTYQIDAQKIAGSMIELESELLR